MQKLTRYSPGGYGAMVPDEGGDYVRAEDVSDLLRWRKVEDGVPENQRTVLVLLKNGDFDVAVFDPEAGWLAPDSDEFYSEPTHWRPIGPMQEGGKP